MWLSLFLWLLYVSTSLPGWPVPWSYRGEADWLVAPSVHPIFLSKNRHGVSVFLITRDYHDFWGVMKSGLANESVNSLRTMGYIISGSTDIHIFRFLLWCLTWSSLLMEMTSLPIPWLKIQEGLQDMRRVITIENWGKSADDISFFISVLTDSPGDIR